VAGCRCTAPSSHQKTLTAWPRARDHREQFSHETLLTWGRRAHPGGPRGRVSAAPRPASVPTTGDRAPRPPGDAPTSHLASAPPSMAAEPPDASQGLGIQASASHKPAPTRLTSPLPPTQAKGAVSRGTIAQKGVLVRPEDRATRGGPGRPAVRRPTGQGQGRRALVSWGHPVSSFDKNQVPREDVEAVPAAPVATGDYVPTSRSSDQDPAFCCSLTGMSRWQTRTNAKRHHTHTWGRERSRLGLPPPPRTSAAGPAPTPRPQHKESKQSVCTAARGERVAGVPLAPHCSPQSGDAGPGAAGSPLKERMARANPPTSPWQEGAGGMANTPLPASGHFLSSGH